MGDLFDGSKPGDRPVQEAREGGWWEYPGPAVLDLIRAWHVEWFPERDSGVVGMDGKPCGAEPPRGPAARPIGRDSWR